MRFTNDQLKKYYFGTYSFLENEEGYLQAFQYTQAQMDYFEKKDTFFFERCTASTSKTLEFLTEATEISFSYKIVWIGSLDTFEMTVDGLISQIYYVKDLKEEGKLSFTLPKGRKNVVIYLPADATVWVKNFEINDKAEVPEKKGKLLWLGDSITQGYGPLRTAHTFVSVANRLLNYDVLNQGIGGYVYDKNSLMKMEGYHPDKIIVSLGTNQFGTESMLDIEEYYERLFEIYGTQIPILCIIPIWRGDLPEQIPILESFCEKLKQIVSRYQNIKIVEGFRLVPHLPEYYLDNLHPNELGAEMYGRNLVLEIERLNF